MKETSRFQSYSYFVRGIDDWRGSYVSHLLSFLALLEAVLRKVPCPPNLLAAFLGSLVVLGQFAE